MKRLLICLLAFAISALASEKVYLAPVGLMGMHQDYAVASAKLMKAYIEDDGRFILVVGSAEDSVTTDDQEAVRKKASEKGCSKYIVAEFTRLGENVIMSFKLYSVDHDAPIWNDRLKARNPDDFDPIIQRVARNIGTRHKAADDSDIYSVTEQESRAPKRKSVSSYIGISVGGLMAVQPDVEVFSGFDFFLMYDAQIMLLSVDWDMYGLGDDAALDYKDLSVSAYYPFGTKAIAPFLGGGLACSWTEYDGRVEKRFYGTDKKSGLTGFVGGGMLFNRSSRVVLLTQVKYMLNFYKISVDEEKKEKAIQGLIFNAGIGFGF